MRPAWRAAIYLLLGLYFASIALFILRPLLGWPIPGWLGPASTLLVWAFALGHARLMLGWRNALIFFGLAFVVGLTLEAVGVATGWVYGRYHYSPRLGPTLFNVPLLIPLAWFMVIYLAHAVTMHLLGQPSSVRQLGLFCTVGAMVATAWDVVADPQMTRTGLWIWEQPGEFFGVPVQNFVGWFVTAWVVLLAYRAATRRWPPRAWAESSRLFTRLPVIAYGGLALSFIISYTAQGEGALALITVFTMGASSLIALAREAPA